MADRIHTQHVDVGEGPYTGRSRFALPIEFTAATQEEAKTKGEALVKRLLAVIAETEGAVFLSGSAAIRALEQTVVMHKAVHEAQTAAKAKRN